MDSKYRIISKEVFDRIPTDGIVGDRNTRQRWNRSHTSVMVKRPFGAEANDRWMNHDEAISILETEGWSISEDDFLSGHF